MDPLKGKTAETSGSHTVSAKLQRIAQLASQRPRMVMTTLAHHIDLSFLMEAYRRTRKDGAVGVDGRTAEEYAENLEENLRSLLERFKSGSYKAPPVRRVHIPKAGSADGTRPIGVPTFEDKVLQRAVVMVLEAIYEQVFLDFSFGFRPGRSPHQALDRLRQGLMKMGGGTAIEVDTRSFFDEMSHVHLRTFLDQRVRDGVLRRTINKWLNAGVMEKGKVSRSDMGSPQGGVISPVLSNVYLHNVVDMWFEYVVKPRLAAHAFMIRFADDIIMIFASERDAQRVMKVLPKRFAKFGLRLHPEKTRFVAFYRPSRVQWGQPKRQTLPSTFPFLGFTHYWARSRWGNWVVKRKTESKRLARALKDINEWCRKHRHGDFRWQQWQLSRKLNGHFAYYGITGNWRSPDLFHNQVQRIWHKWLNRRSQRGKMTWERFSWLLTLHPLPRVRIVHSI